MFTDLCIIYMKNILNVCVDSKYYTYFIYRKVNGNLTSRLQIETILYNWIQHFFSFFLLNIYFMFLFFF